MSVATASEPSLAASPPGATGSRRGYGRYVLNRVAAAFGMLVFVLITNFFLFRILPGDPARSFGRGRFTTQEQIDELQAQLGNLPQTPEFRLVFALGSTGDGDYQFRLFDHLDHAAAAALRWLTG